MYFGEFSQALWKLSELEEFLSVRECQTTWKREYKSSVKPCSPHEQIASRNQEIFDQVRQLAYTKRREGADYKELQMSVSEACKERNLRFSNPLPASEINSLTKSISKYCASKVNPRSISSRHVHNKGAAKRYIKREDDIRRRQSVGARYSQMKRSNQSFREVRQAILNLESEGAELTRSAVVRISGLSKKTVRKYFELAKVCEPQDFERRNECILAERLSQ